MTRNNTQLQHVETARKPIIGYTAGVFDMFHIGHLNILASAREQCDSLIVGVTSDELAESRKGRRPIVPLFERMAIVGGMRTVDKVVAQTSMDKFAAWQDHRFDIAFVGDDWKGSESWNTLETRFAAVSVRVVYFPYTKHTSSSMLRTKLWGDEQTPAH